MATAPPSTTAKELRFERSAPPSRVLSIYTKVYHLFTQTFLPEVCENGGSLSGVYAPEARPAGWLAPVRLAGARTVVLRAPTVWWLACVSSRWTTR